MARMALLLDPSAPAVWRSPSSVQFGVDPVRVVLETVSTLDERLLGALARGATRAALETLAVHVGGAAADADALLERLAPVIVRGGSRARPPARVAIDGTARALAGATAVRIAEMLAAEGVMIAREDASVAVLLASYVVPPRLAGHWLRRDARHLPIVFGERAVTIGPLVEPGRGPCLTCLDLHRTDADPSWPAIASQLLSRRSAAETPLLAAEATSFAVRALLAGGRELHGESVRIDAETGERTHRRWRRHPRCLCSDATALVSSPSPLPPSPHP